LIRAVGAVVETLPKSLYRVEMANGHRLQAHVSGRLRARWDGAALGERLWIEISPCDMSCGAVIGKADDASALSPKLDRLNEKPGGERR